MEIVCFHFLIHISNIYKPCDLYMRCKGIFLGPLWTFQLSSRVLYRMKYCEIWSMSVCCLCSSSYATSTPSHSQKKRLLSKVQSECGLLGSGTHNGIGQSQTTNVISSVNPDQAMGQAMGQVMNQGMGQMGQSINQPMTQVMSQNPEYTTMTNSGLVHNTHTHRYSPYLAASYSPLLPFL